MSWGAYFFLLLAASFVGCFFLARSLFRRGEHGWGILIMLFLPATAALVVYALTFVVSLFIYGNGL